MYKDLVEGPLSDLLVLDLSRVLSGPYCSMFLGDFGARVIKIERPDGGDDTRSFGPPFVAGESTYYMSINRNKQSVAVDLKAPEGREIVAALARRADVLLENFRPGTLERLGLSYAALRQDNPRLIGCSISGFGADVDRPGYDLVSQGMGGFQALTGEAGGAPLKAGLSIADLISGLLAFSGVLLALQARHKSGRGQHVDVSMLDGQVALLTYHAGMYLNGGKEPGRMGNRHPSITPYETFQTADGHINVAAAHDGFFRALCLVLGEAGAALRADPRFASNQARVTHREALQAALAPLFLARGSDAWLAALTAADVPCGPILSVPQVLAHELVQRRRMVEAVPHPELQRRGGPEAVRVTGVPIKLSETPGQVVSAPPLLGQHTREVVSELLGLPADRLADLEARGVLKNLS